MSQNRYVIIIPKTITTADNFIGHPPGGAHPIFIMAIKGRSHFALSGFFLLRLFSRYLRIIFPLYFINYLKFVFSHNLIMISAHVGGLSCHLCPCGRPLLWSLPMWAASLVISAHVGGLSCHLCPCGRPLLWSLPMWAASQSGRFQLVRCATITVWARDKPSACGFPQPTIAQCNSIKITPSMSIFNWFSSLQRLCTEKNTWNALICVLSIH